MATEESRQGRAASPGMAAGPLLRLDDGDAGVRAAGTPVMETAALRRAMAEAADELAGLADAAGDDEAAAVLAVQIALLEDEALTEAAFVAIAGGTPADVAFRAALDAQVADYAAAEDAYFRARAADLEDLRDRVLRRLAGVAERALPGDAILAAADLPPSRFLAVPWAGGGLALERGSATSHVAILARARGVPMLVGVALRGLEDGAPALLDGAAGTLVVRPDPATAAAFAERRAAWEERRAVEAAYLAKPAVTADGTRVRVMLNIAGPDDLAPLDPAHVDGIGLVRSEFLFQGRDRLPGEEEQLAAYRRILDWAGDRPVTIRTLDAGGDKPIPGLTRAGEGNPFLGVRGLRLSLRHPEVFRVQLRALARAAVAGNLKVMVPMVSVPDELRRCRDLLDEALAGLEGEGVPAARPPLGMMVEVPAAALSVADFDADFLSIGSNDLIQYTMAASRDEPELAELAEPSPAVMELIARVAVHGAATGREVSLCGDLAGEPRHVPALLGAGLRTLSMAPTSVAAVKAAVARWRAAG
ncbi:phosphoenolpyruvate--protein phosphotransferase [Azospirillum sp. RWY-5-1]|uniref:Phosphoenolpyruvate-protein phosphotransferase n=2 Tax=Azospirillum oleiclasticum TaxID=2735135 RepID=A0ABX2TE15_9PROT|nr:phosphoenolpyruvate--protein phosphotransferase [Azospirillum oleiclasticum]NYZ15548.1 phosphoenolpyruvate--protein phosphotransferase [Azospirillum oleiclasticum]NYZ22571.1 phosphoenolpyruvate--protein phosphotransferase [Azospirillum oleiclasticum]